MIMKVVAESVDCQMSTVNLFANENSIVCILVWHFLPKTTRETFCVVRCVVACTVECTVSFVLTQSFCCNADANI